MNLYENLFYIVFIKISSKCLLINQQLDCWVAFLNRSRQSEVPWFVVDSLITITMCTGFSVWVSYRINRTKLVKPPWQWIKNQKTNQNVK